MSKSKFNPLISASVMSAVYLAGISTNAQAVVTDESVTDNLSHLEAIDHRTSVEAAPNALGHKRYIIQLDAPALANFSGNSLFSAIPRKGQRLDVDTIEAQSYLAHLKNEQDQTLDAISNALGRNVEAVLSFQTAYNGMAVYLAPHELLTVNSTSGIRRIIPDRDYFLTTDAGPTLIGANNVWGVDGIDNDLIFAGGFEAVVPGNFGAGVVIGTLDSGANFDHPSFAEVGGDGYVHTNPLGAGNYLGVCDSNNIDQYIDTYTCNSKLIGGYDFLAGLVPGDGVDIAGPEDENGHGSHTASTSGGNMLDDAEILGITGIQVSGVAPHANHVIFDVCYNNAQGRGACPGASSIASVDQAIADGVVDVINFSISGGNSPWNDPVSQAFLNATASGIFVAVSAGNSGPGPGTLGHVEPWTASSGASTHNRRFSNSLTASGPGAVPKDLVGALAIQGSGPVLVTDMTGTMEYSGNVDAGNVEGCAAFPANAFDGLIAVISRGGCGFADKVNNATTAGATGVIVHNNVPGDPIVMGALEATTIPSVMVTMSVGMSLDAYIDANPGMAMATVDAGTSINLNGQPDSMAGFSSRGPSPFEYNKPDVTAPGVSILAAVDDDDVGTGTAAEYGLLQGTSMSSPHTAGSAALLKGINPGWSVPEIKSALMMTAVTDGVTKEDGLTPADPFDRGAGRVRVDIAAQAGLVMDETALNFFAADPANGGDPKTLNVPSITDYACYENCSFQRGFRSVADEPVTYNASVEGIPGTVTPSTFTVNPGQFAILTIDLDSTGVNANEYAFGNVLIEPEVSFSTFSASPAAAIPDDGYDGTLASMACGTVSVSGVGTASDVLVDVGLTHTYVGDITLKLVNPDDLELGLMSRAGLDETDDDGTNCCGGNANLEATSPITFSDTASVSAENIDPALNDDDVICSIDGICDFSPAPGAVAQPPASLAEMVTGTVDGDWMLCAGDSVGQDSGSLETVAVKFPEAQVVPSLHMPVVIAGFPEIDVTPAELTQSLLPDESANQMVNVANLPEAGADLTWSVVDDLSLTDYKLYEQLNTGTGNSIVSDVFVNVAGQPGAYSAEFMTLTEATDIDKMFFDGSMSNGDTMSTNIASMTVTIYNDNAGVPANHPEDGLNGEVYSLTLPVGDANLDLGADTGTVSFDILGNDGVPLNLAAGSYWVTAYANFTGANRWNWFAGVNGTATNASLIDPNDLFGAGLTDWTDLTLINPIFAGLAFNVSRGLTCGASWLSVDVANGVETPGSSTDLTVTIDSTGLAPGDYEAAVCIASNDLDEALVSVPVFLTVDPPPPPSP